MIDNNNNYYTGHLERVIQKQIYEICSVHNKTLTSFRMINSQDDYLLLIKCAIMEFDLLSIMHLKNLKFLVQKEELDMSHYYKENALKYKVYYTNNLLHQDYKTNIFAIGLLLYTAKFNILEIGHRVSFIKNNEFDRVMFLFPTSEFLWKYSTISFDDFFTSCNDDMGEYKHLLYEIERVQLIEVINQCKLMIEFMMFSKNYIHIKGMLDKTLNVLEEMSCRHKQNLYIVIKARNLDCALNNILIDEIINLIKYNFCIYEFDDETEVCDAINWILDKVDILKHKLYNKYV